jgi:hypothetical protein
MFERRFGRSKDGRIHLHLPPHERELLRDVAASVRALIDEDEDDPAVQRLFPAAHEDPELEQEYRDLTRTQLRSGREQALALLEETVDAETLSAEQADAWLRALNDARLVLGTRLDVTEDFDWDSLDAGHPDAEGLAAYAYLSWIQEQLVAATDR